MREFGLPIIVLELLVGRAALFPGVVALTFCWASGQKRFLKKKGGGKFRMWLKRVVSDILGCVLEVWYVFGGLGIHGEPF